MAGVIRVLCLAVLLLSPSPGVAGAASASITVEKQPYIWALIGNELERYSDERAVGISAKTFELHWREYFPTEGGPDLAYVARKRAELRRVRAAGFQVILSLGYHDPPSWVHGYPDSYYVNQFGERYLPVESLDNGDVNLVFNPDMRALVERYMAQVLGDFGTDFMAIRLGGGRYGELTYPPTRYGATINAYWAFDAQALARSPTPHWKPGLPSPNGEAAAFLGWYLDQLVDFQSWQIAALRRSYRGTAMMLYPSWGIRPSQFEAAVATDLNGSSSAEINGEIQRGYDFARQIAAIDDPGIIVTTTWLDADASRDDGPDQRYWSPVKFLASLAAAHPLRLQVFGENTGQGDPAAMERSARQMVRHGLLGMAWFRESELSSRSFASIGDYDRLIRATAPP
jgi:hypothetical protein